MYGIDISNNNGHVNLQQAKQAGVVCVYMKATEGTTFQDPYLEENYNKAKEAGLKIGFYHFLVGSSEPETQATNFFNQIKGKDMDLVPMLDVEVNFNNLNNYMNRFIQKFQQLANTDIGIYSYTSFINEHITQSFAPYKLWEANYNNQPWKLPGNFFNTVVGHQYSDKGNVPGVGVCDINEFNDKVLLSQKITSSNPTGTYAAIASLERARNYVGSQTYELQCYLAACGYPVGTLDGIFGEKTYSCVINFQKDSGLDVDALAGPNTFYALKKRVASTVVSGIKYKTPAATRIIQRILGIGVDGIFGPKTEKAVRHFQQAHGLLVDGVVGKNTWTRLLNL